MQLADLNQAAVHSIMENCWNKRKEWRKRQQSSQEAKEPTAVTYDGSNIVTPAKPENLNVKLMFDTAGSPALPEPKKSTTANK
ncbi:unnamed protein product [Bursaphelenchus xylophilus]|uniref:(pine wood nematode) hypothetical protein n=1 Tax=Bursaphelenchus xylophilus TaxID=6326 RepID=A0A7I8XKD2_BURXY|nr:unnamed protein product [Bursaphelenchus xylophilus]CAG9120893.1 unnamed protein product [Bursaphelenchus xylophilus]